MALFRDTDGTSLDFMFAGLVAILIGIIAAVFVSGDCCDVYEGEVVGHRRMVDQPDSTVLKTKDSVVLVPNYVLQVGSRVKVCITRDGKTARVIEVE